MMQETAYIMTGDGRISIVHNGKAYSVDRTHPNYIKILDAISNSLWEGLENILDIPKAITTYLSSKVTFCDGVFSYNGEPVNNGITNRIFEFMGAGLPHQPLIRFLDNVMKNPSGRSVQELYGFLEHKGLPITPDGCFMAYKSIRKDNKDIYSGTIDNSPGNVVKFERNKVDDNCNNTCSYGLHVGTLEYASSYAGCNGKVVLVKVNPMNAVSVPTDHDAQKLRVSEYEVIQEVESILPNTIYGEHRGYDDGEEFGCGDDDDDFDDESWEENY